MCEYDRSRWHFVFVRKCNSFVGCRWYTTSQASLHQSLLLPHHVHGEHCSVHSHSANIVDRDRIADHTIPLSLVLHVASSKESAHNRQAVDSK
jgi:hypothetical protein